MNTHKYSIYPSSQDELDWFLPDVAFQRRVLICCLLLGLGGLIAIVVFRMYQHYFFTLLQTDLQRALDVLQRDILIGSGLHFLITFGASLYLIGLARKTAQSGQYPPPGMRVIRKTRIQRGKQAGRISWRCYVLAGLLFSTNGITLFIWSCLASVSKAAGEYGGP